jgi:hypothetical protein
MASYAYATRLSQNLARTAEGYLLCTNVILARSGIQQYKRSELGLDGPDTLVDVDRPIAEVTSKTFLASLIGKGVTLQHPSGGMLSAATHAQSAIGVILAARVGEETDSDGNVLILGDVIIHDPTAITLVETGQQRQLSVGYTFSPYEGPDGELEMRDLVANHLALVPRGRAGVAEIVDAVPLPAAPIEDYTAMMKRFHRVNPQEAAPAPAPTVWAYDDGDDISGLITKIASGEDEDEDTMNSESMSARLDRLCALLEKLIGSSKSAEDLSTARPGDNREKPSTLGTELIPVDRSERPTNPVIDSLRALRPYIQASGDRAAIDAFNSAMVAAKRGNVGPAERLLAVHDRKNSQGDFEASVLRVRARLLGEPEPIGQRFCRPSLVGDHRQEVSYQSQVSEMRERMLSGK